MSEQCRTPRFTCALPGNPLCQQQRSTRSSSGGESNKNIHEEWTRQRLFEFLYPLRKSEFSIKRRFANLLNLENIHPLQISEIHLKLIYYHSRGYYLMVWLGTCMEPILVGSYWICADTFNLITCGIHFPAEPERAGEVVFETRLSALSLLGNGSPTGMVCVPSVLKKEDEDIFCLSIKCGWVINNDHQQTDIHEYIIPFVVAV